MAKAAAPVAITLAFSLFSLASARAAWPFHFHLGASEKNLRAEWCAGSCNKAFARCLLDRTFVEGNSTEEQATEECTKALAHGGPEFADKGCKAGCRLGEKAKEYSRAGEGEPCSKSCSAKFEGCFRFYRNAKHMTLKNASTICRASLDKLSARWQGSGCVPHCQNTPSMNMLRSFGLTPAGVRPCSATCHNAFAHCLSWRQKNQSQPAAFTTCRDLVDSGLSFMNRKGCKPQCLLGAQESQAVLLRKTVGSCSDSCKKAFKNCLGYHSKRVSSDVAEKTCRKTLDAGSKRLLSQGCVPHCELAETVA